MSEDVDCEDDGGHAVHHQLHAHREMGGRWREVHVDGEDDDGHGFGLADAKLWWVRVRAWVGG